MMHAMRAMQANIEHEGLDINNVTTWNGRPKRTHKPPPKTYWEEYVQTDEWYLKKLVEDIPPEEMHAAIDDEDLNDAGEEGDSDVETDEDDSDFDEVCAPGEFELSDDIPSEGEEESDGSSDTESTTTGSHTTGQKAQVQRTPERK